MVSDERRVLGPFSTTCVVIGAIVGVGIFFTPRTVAQLTGSPDVALLAWGLGGLLALLGALTFAELGGLETGPASQYRVLRQCYGRGTGFLFGFCNFTAVQAGAVAVIGMICARYLRVAAGLDAGAFSEPVGGFVIISVMAAVHLMGVRWGASIQNVTVVAKVAALLAIIGLAFLQPSRAMSVAEAAPDAGGWDLSGLGPALLPVLFTFGGFQQALWISGEVRRPQRTLPFAIVLGVLVVILCYELVNWAYLDLLGFEGVLAAESGLAADAVRTAWPGIGARLAAGAVGISALGVLNAQLLTGPRYVAAMAEEGDFFSPFGTRGSAEGTPWLGIVTLALLSTGLILADQWLVGAGGIGGILSWAVFVDWIFFGLTGAALPMLRRMRPSDERPFRVPLYPLVPGLFTLGAAAVLVGALLDPETRRFAHYGLLWVLLGLLLFRLLLARPRRG